MALKAKTTTKILYSMGEVCEMFDLPAATIRFWEKSFKQIKPQKNAKGNRMFTPNDIEVLKVIYHLLKEKGMTIAGADKFLCDNKKAAQKEANVVEILQRIRATLVDIKTEIASHETKQDHEIIIENEQDVDDAAGEQSDISVEEASQNPSKSLYYEPTLFDF